MAGPSAFDLSESTRPGPSEAAGGREKTKTENKRGGGRRLRDVLVRRARGGRPGNPARRSTSPAARARCGAPMAAWHAQLVERRGPAVRCLEPLDQRRGEAQPARGGRDAPCACAPLPACGRQADAPARARGPAAAGATVVPAAVAHRRRCARRRRFATAARMRISTPRELVFA